MKIGLLYTTPAKTSGAGVFQQSFAEGLKRKGQKVSIFYPSCEKLIDIPRMGYVLLAASLWEHKNKVKNQDVQLHPWFLFIIRLPLPFLE